MDSETLEIIRTFVAESLDSLDEQEEKIQNLNQSGSKESINSIFRAFHTIKGLSGFLSFNIINTVTQEVEVLLDFLRKNPQALSETVIALIRDSFSLLRMLLHTVREVTKDVGHEEAVRNHISRLKQSVIQMKSAPEGSIATPSSTSSVSFDSFSSVAPQSDVVSPSGSSAPFYLNTDKTIVSTIQEAQKVSVQQVSAPKVVVSDVQHRSAANEDKQQDESAENVAIPKNSFPQEHSLRNRTNAGISEDDLQHFIPESLDMISTIELGCNRLEQNPHDMTVIGAMLLIVLRLKENSSFMGFAEMERKSADIEDILEAVRNKVLKVYPGLISMLLSTVMSMKIFIQDVASGRYSTTPRRINEPIGKVFSPLSVLPESASESHLPPNDELSSENVLHTRREVLLDADTVERFCLLVKELVSIEPILTNDVAVHGVEVSSFKNAAENLHKITCELHEVTKLLGNKVNIYQSHALK